MFILLSIGLIPSPVTGLGMRPTYTKVGINYSEHYVPVNHYLVYSFYMKEVHDLLYSMYSVVEVALNLNVVTWLWYKDGGLWGNCGEISFILHSSQESGSCHLELVGN